MAQNEWVPLADAAQNLAVGWYSARQLVLRGELEGRRTARGAWEVSVESIERFQAQQQRATV